MAEASPSASGPTAHIAHFAHERRARWSAAPLLGGAESGAAPGEDGAAALAELAQRRRSEGDIVGALEALACARYICEASRTLAGAAGEALCTEIGDLHVLLAGHGKDAFAAFEEAQRLRAESGAAESGALAKRLADALAASGERRRALRAYDKARVLLGGEDADYLDVARLLEARGALLAGEAADSAEALEALGEARRKREGGGSIETLEGAVLLAHIGDLRLRRGDTALCDASEALVVLEEAARIRRRIGAHETVEYLHVLEGNKMARLASGQHLVLNVLEEAAQLRRSLGCLATADGSTTMVQIGDLQLERGNTAEAHEAYMCARGLSKGGDFEATNDTVLLACKIGELRSGHLEDALGALAAFEDAYVLRQRMGGKAHARGSADAALLTRLGDARLAVGEDVDSPVFAHQEALYLHDCLGTTRTLAGAEAAERLGVARAARAARRGDGDELYWETRKFLGASLNSPGGVGFVTDLLLQELNFTWKSQELGGGNGPAQAFDDAVSIREELGELQTPEGARLLERLGTAKRLRGDSLGALDAYWKAVLLYDGLGLAQTPESQRVRDLWSEAGAAI